MSGSELLHIFITGLIILVGAIVINGLAKAVGLLTWYDFIAEWSEKGVGKALADAGLLSVLFLFFLYPFLLGMLGYGGMKLLS